MITATLKSIKSGTKLRMKETGHIATVRACGTGPNHGWVRFEYDNVPANAHNRGLKRSMHVDILEDIYEVLN